MKSIILPIFFYLSFTVSASSYVEDTLNLKKIFQQIQESNLQKRKEDRLNNYIKTVETSVNEQKILEESIKISISSVEVISDTRFDTINGRYYAMYGATESHICSIISIPRFYLSGEIYMSIEVDCESGDDHTKNIQEIFDVSY